MFNPMYSYSQRGALWRTGMSYVAIC